MTDTQAKALSAPDAEPHASEGSQVIEKKKFFEDLQVSEAAKEPRLPSAHEFFARVGGDNIAGSDAQPAHLTPPASPLSEAETTPPPAIPVAAAPAVQPAAASDAPPPANDWPEIRSETAQWMSSPAGALSVDESAPALRSLADWCARASTRGPLRLGLFGPAGSGKSFALSRILASVRALSAGAQAHPSAFTQRLLVARVDASEGRAPACALAAAVYSAMCGPGAPPAFAALAQEAALAGADVQDAARAAADRLMEARRRVDSERQILQELSGRSAQLNETVLYKTGGSRVDAWARANRSRIEGRLRAFGFDVGDVISTYKDLVRDIAERRGFPGRVGVYLRAMWGFPGQTRLLVFAALLMLGAWGLGQAQTSQPHWLGWMRGSGDVFVSLANWMQARGDWFGALVSVSHWIAFGLLALNIVRATRFVAPLARGAALLDVDVQAAQRNLDALIGQQTRLVDGLVAETESHARRAEDAERRAALQGDESRSSAATPFDEAADASLRQARAFFMAIAHHAEADSSNSAPQKVLVAVDNLDALPPQAAAAFLDEAARTLAFAPFILLVAADPRQLTTGWSKDFDAAWGLERISARVHAALRIEGASRKDFAQMVRELTTPGAAPDSPALDVTHSLHDEKLGAQELALLEDLAPYAGRTPRDVERLLLLYRLARPRTSACGALALALTWAMGASQAETSALQSAIESADDSANLIAPAGQARFAEALRLAEKAGPISVGAWRAAQAIAADYWLRAS